MISSVLAGKVCDMDVKLTLLISICLFLSACGSKSSQGEDTTNKAVDICLDQKLFQQRLIRWKNGKVTKHDLKKIGETRFQEFLNRNQQDIEFIEDNFKIPKPQPAPISLLGWGGYLNWGVDAISAETLWQQNILGESVIVAVIDSGIDMQHPQLAQQLYTNPNETRNGLDDDGNGLVDDLHGYDFPNKSGDLYDSSGHGTHVSGIIAADHGTGSVKGVAPKAKLVMFDFFSDDGDGSVFDAIAAIRAAEMSGAKVINASWGGPSCSRSLRAAIDDLEDKNILFITASGNESLNIDRMPTYPAAYTSSAQITVGAMTADELTAGFSNYGDRVHIVAPGVDIVSTYPLPDLTAVEDGTSMAAPFVSGAAALLWSAFPDARAQDIKKAILDSAKSGPYPVLTRGSLDVTAAHQALKINLARRRK